jgi:hypothetical protein
MRVLSAILLAALLAVLTSTVALADDPHVGSSGHFSTATCPVDGNPNCPPFGG